MFTLQNSIFENFICGFEAPYCNKKLRKIILLRIVSLIMQVLSLNERKYVFRVAV